MRHHSSDLGNRGDHLPQPRLFFQELERTLAGVEAGLSEKASQLALLRSTLHSEDGAEAGAGGGAQGNGSQNPAGMASNRGARVVAIDFGREVAVVEQAGQPMRVISFNAQTLTIRP